MSEGEQWLDLYDFRQRVATLYARRREALGRGDTPVSAWDSFRAGRDELFARHPQSALDGAQRAAFTGLDYFPYDDHARVEATLVYDVVHHPLLVSTSGEDVMPMTPVGRLHFQLREVDCALTLYWIDVYGGGLFLPFRDSTASGETYGGGRYVVDSVKGSDFISVARQGSNTQVEIDFNYAYNPSCAYHYRWACPLAPRENYLSVQVRAGERAFASTEAPA